MAFSLKDVFKKDEETLVVDRRKQAIKWLIILSVVLIIMIIAVVFLKSLNSADDNRRKAITRDIQSIQYYVKNASSKAKEDPSYEYPGVSLEDQPVVVNGEEYRYGYFVLYPQDYLDIASALNLSEEYYIVNYDSYDVVNYDGIKYNKKMYYSIDDLIAIDEGRIKEIPSEHTIIIRNATDMQYLAMYPSADFKLAGDIDMTAYSSGAGWDPVANFSGKLDGKGYTISGLTIQRPTQSHVGLFKDVTDKGVIQNVNFSDVSITGENYTGVVAGTTSGTIRNVKIEGGTVTAGNGNDVGGIVGSHQIGTISNCKVSLSTISGRNEVGGAVGIFNSGIIEKVMVNCSNIYALEFVGGFAGTAVATSTSYMHECTANTTISARNSIGGLIGKVEMMSDNKLDIMNSYALGSITGGQQNIGGMIGYIYTTAGTTFNLTKCYTAVSILNKLATSGGCIGLANISTSTIYDITYDYWEKNLAVGEVLNGVGAITTGTARVNFEDKTYDEMRYHSTFVNWDLAKIWGIDERISTPYLRFEKNI